MTTKHGSDAVVVGGRPLRIPDVVAVARHSRRVHLAPEARAAMERSRAAVIRALHDDRPVYGVSTGFGALANVRISPDDRAALQVHLLRSHAAGVGEPLPDEVVRAAMLLRAQAVARGYSGVRPVVVERLLDLLNADIHPIVPDQGSVGASGDLAPLAHLALPLIGEGHVRVQGTVQPAASALQAAGIAPLVLEAKEALALINGTQIITALLALAVADTQGLLRAAEIAAAMSFDALGGHPTALAAPVHQVRPHPGQVSTAARLRALLQRDGCLPRATRDAVQDPYTLRCIPQVLGPVRGALESVQETVHIEINAVTDNPLCFPDDTGVVSGGNFHGHPVALASDYLKLAVASLGTFTERRIASLVDPRSSGLPAFLTPSPGLHSGLMLAQYVAASLAAENKVLAHPSSVDSIPTSADIEDFNSMGTTAARHLARVVANTETIVAIEVLCAAQAIDLTGRPPWGVGTEAAYRVVRSRIPFLDGDDRPLHELIGTARDLVHSGTLQHAVEAALGESHDEAPDPATEGGDA
ncbi:MAG: histidine ammonia-lyase [Sphaerobacter sp.]|nr:histidine ammonia-lyase [Sphaerobacter sp.]